MASLELIAENCAYAANMAAALLGTWPFTRTITGYPEMRGTAQFHEFQASPSSLLYREELLFPAPNGELLPGHREYLYKFLPGLTADEPTLTIYFVRGAVVGELFMQLSFKNNCANGSHLCYLDLYKGMFELLSPQHLRITYSITGPKKDHRIVTDYLR